jgi:hypothetical protein
LIRRLHWMEEPASLGLLMLDPLREKWVRLRVVEGLTEDERFVQGYGFDVMNWYGYETLADLRELMMTVWLSRRIATDEGAATEFGRRIADLRSNGDRHGWQPF